MSVNEIPESTIEVEGLPDDCNIEWKKIEEKPIRDGRYYYEAKILWSPHKNAATDKYNELFTLKITKYEGKDRRFELRVRGGIKEEALFKKESGFAGVISSDIKRLDFEFREGVSASSIDVSGPSWLLIRSEIVERIGQNDILAVSLSMNNSPECPPIAGNFNLSVKCTVKGMEVVRKIPISIH